MATGAVLIGAVAGYTWLQAPSPEAQQRADQDRTRIEQSVYYEGCNEVRELGKDPIYEGQPGYRKEMDGDGDGIACEPFHQH